MTGPSGHGLSSQSTLQKLPASLTFHWPPPGGTPDRHFAHYYCCIASVPRSVSEPWLMMVAEDLRRWEVNISCQNWHSLAEPVPWALILGGKVGSLARTRTHTHTGKYTNQIKHETIRLI